MHVQTHTHKHTQAHTHSHTHTLSLFHSIFVSCPFCSVVMSSGSQFLVDLIQIAYLYHISRLSVLQANPLDVLRMIMVWFLYLVRLTLLLTNFKAQLSINALTLTKSVYDDGYLEIKP